MFTVVLSNVLAIISYIAKEQPWSEALSVFSVVFIMLFVFVILLEFVWLHHRAKAIDDPAIKSKYKMAKIIYGVLFVIGFFITYVVLAI